MVHVLRKTMAAIRMIAFSIREQTMFQKTLMQARQMAHFELNVKTA